jgi:hypothetical protein
LGLGSTNHTGEDRPTIPDWPRLHNNEMDQLATGRKLRMLAIIDPFSRPLPAIGPGFIFRGPDVAEILE